MENEFILAFLEKRQRTGFSPELQDYLPEEGDPEQAYRFALDTHEAGLEEIESHFDP